MLKYKKIGKYKVRVIDKKYNFDFITSDSWLQHLDTLSAIDLQKAIADVREVIKNTRPTIDRDLVYENHLLITFSWKLMYKQQLTLF